MSKPKGTMHKPGQKAPESGQYGVIGPKGGKTGLRSHRYQRRNLAANAKARPGIYPGGQDQTQR
jgi:hypothetical protein